MEIKLSAQKREKNEKLSADFIPAVIYGKGVENVSLKLGKVEFEKAFAKAGESNLISLDFGSGPVNVVIKDTQRDVLKGTFAHVDFYQVNMKEKITAEIPLHFSGEARAVRELGGIFVKNVDHVEVECLPGALVDHIDVDISSLNTFDDAIRIKDLILPSGMAVTSEPEEMVAAVREPKAETEPEVAAAAPVAAPAAGAKKEEGKKEEAKPEAKK